jgi:hypothetical protein
MVLHQVHLQDFPTLTHEHVFLRSVSVTLLLYINGKLITISKERIKSAMEFKYELV